MEYLNKLSKRSGRELMGLMVLAVTGSIVYLVCVGSLLCA